MFPNENTALFILYAYRGKSTDIIAVTKRTDPATQVDTIATRVSGGRVGRKCFTLA